ncbi:hypothetical protein [Helicobacter bilis]|uniref:hypothetical protein n=1 Tax=Helicobacter bilis TaxID=37372 RepID=UPI00248EAC69|nr:hypothetical protein [Helicobacter bilis]
MALSYLINVGLSLIANNHHRFDLGFKIPTLGITPSLEGDMVIHPNTYETNTI